MPSHCVASLHIRWHHMTWHDMTWHLATNYITSPHVTSQPTTLFHLTSQPCNHMTSHTTRRTLHHDHRHTTTTQPSTTKTPPPHGTFEVCTGSHWLIALPTFLVCSPVKPPPRARPGISIYVVGFWKCVVLRLCFLQYWILVLGLQFCACAICLFSDVLESLRDIVSSWGAGAVVRDLWRPHEPLGGFNDFEGFNWFNGPPRYTWWLKSCICIDGSWSTCGTEEVAFRSKQVAQRLIEQSNNSLINVVSSEAWSTWFTRTSNSAEICQPGSAEQRHHSRLWGNEATRQRK